MTRDAPLIALVDDDEDVRVALTRLVASVKPGSDERPTPWSAAVIDARHLITAAVALCAAISQNVHAELSAEDLAKISQNPVGNLISLPFQYSARFNYGSQKKTQSGLNFQPVIPIEVNDDWNIITRSTLSMVWQPPLFQGDERTSGLGDFQITAFLSPAKPEEWIWGAGPIMQAPTHGHQQLGNDHWGLGPSVLLVHIDKSDPWVYGVLTNNVWSVGSGNGSPAYNNGFIQPILNYNFPDGTYLTSQPQITVDWKANSGQQWTVPLGGGIGHIFRFGKLPVNMYVTAYYNVVKPDLGPNWQLLAQVKFMFPK